MLSFSRRAFAFTRALFVTPRVVSHSAVVPNSVLGYQRRFARTTTSDPIKDEAFYSHLVEETLINVLTNTEEALESVPDFDAEYKDGVLTLKLGSHGTYVINKQTPNRQIWWSSPISGPRRYEWDAKEGKWLDKKDRTPLADRLREELKQLTQIDVRFETKN